MKKVFMVLLFCLLLVGCEPLPSGNGVVISKSHQPGGMILAPVSTGKGITAVPQTVQPQWTITVKIGDKKRDVSVTKEEYESLKEGSEYWVK